MARLTCHNLVCNRYMQTQADTNNCSNCGSRLVKQSTDRTCDCGSELLPSDRFCGHCGTQRGQVKLVAGARRAKAAR